MVNKVFLAIGEIRGSNDYEVMLIKGKYHWTINNPKINIRPDSSSFICEAKVDIGPFTYKTPVYGDVKIWYDNKKNEINIKITRAIFELFTVILGKKIHIKDIDFADYFKDPFAFDGPQSMGTSFEFMMPDSTKKTIYVQPSECVMEITFQQIIIRCEVEAADKPLKSKIILKPLPNKEVQKPKDTKVSGK